MAVNNSQHSMTAAYQIKVKLSDDLNSGALKHILKNIRSIGNSYIYHNNSITNSVEVLRDDSDENLIAIIVETLRRGSYFELFFAVEDQEQTGIKHKHISLLIDLSRELSFVCTLQVNMPDPEGISSSNPYTREFFLSQNKELKGGIDLRGYIDLLLKITSPCAITRLWILNEDHKENTDDNTQSVIGYFPPGALSHSPDMQTSEAQSKLKKALDYLIRNAQSYGAHIDTLDTQKLAETGFPIHLSCKTDWDTFTLVLERVIGETTNFQETIPCVADLLKIVSSSESKISDLRPYLELLMVLGTHFGFEDVCTPAL